MLTIGVSDELKGQVPRGFVVLKAGVDRDSTEVEAELVALVRAQIGAVAALPEVAVVAALPKTRSGKILRQTVRQIADGAEEPVPSTIDDPTILEELRPSYASREGCCRLVEQYQLLGFGTNP